MGSPIFLGEEYDDYVANLLRISERFQYDLVADQLLHQFKWKIVESWIDYLKQQEFYAPEIENKWDSLIEWVTNLNLVRKSALFDDTTYGTNVLWRYSFWVEMSSITIDIDEIQFQLVYLHSIGNTDINVDQLFMSIFCHELAHLSSSEYRTREELDTSRRLYELRKSILGSDQPDEDIFYLLKYRSGIYIDFIWSDEDLKLNLINEAITELIAEEVYSHIQSENPNITMGSYVFTYQNEVKILKQSLTEFSEEMGQSYDVIWEKIRKWYFLWGEDFKYVFVEIIDQIYPRFCKYMTQLDK